MKYIIEENKKCLFVDDDKERLINTLMFLPDYTEEDIKEVEDDDLELAYTGDTYLKGYAPEKPQSLINQERIKELKKNLSKTDYITAKIAEGAATKEEYADVIAQRQAWRDEINELEKNIS